LALDVVAPLTMHTIESDINQLVKNMTEQELYSSFFGELNEIEGGYDSLDSFGEEHLGSSPSSPPEVIDGIILRPIKPDPEASPPLTRAPQKKRKTARKNVNQTNKKPRVSVKQEEKKFEVLGHAPKPEKHKKRLEANKKSAQASRERKKILKNELEIKVQELSQENKNLCKEIIELETENKVLKSEFIQLQKIISQSPVNLLASSNNKSPVKGKGIKKTNGDSKDAQSNCPPGFSGAAFMYLVIVLQSFSQHFLSLQESKGMIELPNPPITVR